MTSPHPLRAALTVSYVAVAWSLVSGTAAVVVGVRAGSTALIGTGTDVLADLVSSVVLVQRFRLEMHGREPGARVEHRAHTVAAAALLAVAAGVALAAVARLASGDGATGDALALVIAAVSVVVLPALAIVKLRIAPTVPSPALRTDAFITLVGSATAAMTLVGLLLTRTLHWTAADPLAALAIALLAGATGAREMTRR